MQGRKTGRENCRGKGEEVFVLALWMSISVELNCQLMRFPKHVLPFKSGPQLICSPDSSRGQSIPKGLRIPRTLAGRIEIISGSELQIGQMKFIGIWQ